VFDSPFLTVKEAALYLRCSPRTLYRMIQRGEIPHKRIGGGIRLRKDELEAWLEERSARAVS
jgi:excisionase family DNA binding protein